jgi:hypothetical protein
MRFLCGARAASSSSSSWVVRNQLLRLSPVEPPRCAPRPTLPHRDFQQLLVRIRPLVHPPPRWFRRPRPPSTRIHESRSGPLLLPSTGGMGRMSAASWGEIGAAAWGRWWQQHRGGGERRVWRCGGEMGWRCGGDGGCDTVGDGDYNWYFSFSPSELLLPPPVPSSSGVAAPA